VPVCTVRLLPTAVGWRMPEQVKAWRELAQRRRAAAEGNVIASMSAILREVADELDAIADERERALAGEQPDRRHAGGSS
jgi:hypothetical protein